MTAEGCQTLLVPELPDAVQASTASARSSLGAVPWLTLFELSPAGDLSLGFPASELHESPASSSATEYRESPLH